MTFDPFLLVAEQIVRYVHQFHHTLFIEAPRFSRKMRKPVNLILHLRGIAAAMIIKTAAERLVAIRTHF